jgi:hypothetical protein
MVSSDYSYQARYQDFLEVTRKFELAALSAQGLERVYIQKVNEFRQAYPAVDPALIYYSVDCAVAFQFCMYNF